MDKGETMYLTHSFSDRGRRTSAPMFSLRALVPLLAALVAVPPALAGTTLDRIKETRTLRLGYGPETPLMQKDASGKPTGFAIGLCQKIAEAAKLELNLPALAVEYVPVTGDGGVAAVAQGKVDVLCDPTPPTAAARKQVSFSIPVFASGIGAVLRRDGSQRLKDILTDRSLPTTPNWRGNADQLVRNSTMAVISGARAERLLIERLSEKQIIPKIVTVDDPAAGVAQVVEGRANVFFADKAVLFDAVKRSGASGDLQILDRYFTQDTFAFAVARDDEDLRLLVDSALSRLYRSSDFSSFYATWFGQPLGEVGLILFRLNALAE
jgi:ABC-type amino acid transport substrate-binding protein